MFCSGLSCWNQGRSEADLMFTFSNFDGGTVSTAASICILEKRGPTNHKQTLPVNQPIVLGNSDLRPSRLKFLQSLLHVDMLKRVKASSIGYETMKSIHPTEKEGWEAIATRPSIWEWLTRCSHPRNVGIYSWTDPTGNTKKGQKKLTLNQTQWVWVPWPKLLPLKFSERQRSKTSQMPYTCHWTGSAPVQAHLRSVSLLVNLGLKQQSWNAHV